MKSQLYQNVDQRQEINTLLTAITGILLNPNASTTIIPPYKKTNINLKYEFAGFIQN